MIRAFQWDLARQVERLDWLLAQLPKYAEWGYNELYLHLEDAVEYPSLPGVARKDAYSHRQLGRLVDAARGVGINVVPIVNLLGHTQYLIKVPALRELNELVDDEGRPLERGQICPVHPRTIEIASRLLSDVRPFCTAGKVHVGLDESFLLGRHARSRAEIERIGLPAHFARYVGALRELTRSAGLGMGLWADMLYFLPEAIPLLPTDIAAYEWYYYSFGRKPRVELFNFRETDVGERLRSRGLAYWGCPMNGSFRHEPLPHFSDRLANVVSWWHRCRRLRAEGFLIASWEPSRLAQELTTVVDAAAASLWLDGEDDPRAMLERGFARVFGTGDRGAAARRKARTAAALALACDRYPFSGYPRWEINERWDTISGREPVATYRAEARYFDRLRKRAIAAGVPLPLRASIDLRWYLAERDVRVREARRALGAGRGPGLGSKYRQALRIGLRAARTMWERTRDRGTDGSNVRILRADRDRAEAAGAGKPIFGSRWQLCYRVHNVSPAVQLVAVEQKLEGQPWQTRQACHTIEFQAIAARRRTGIVREHAAPVDWDGDLNRPPQLRIVVRGIGRVAVSELALTDGHRTFRAQSKRWIGRPAPRSGFPVIDWAGVQEAAPVTCEIAATPRGRRMRTRPTRSAG
ncbi:MAG TPA: family 20 glycosylhydrolase [Opitutaceae bacterium]|nr:family 20 glycosylhydrolase [Opitutaceae bacterium]